MDLPNPPNPDSPVDQFRSGFLSLLETLRFSIVLLHNEVVKHIQNRGPAPAPVAPDDPVNPANPATPETTPQTFELLDGKNNFITRIEQLKHDVAFQQEIGLKDMMNMVDKYNTLKKDVTDLLQVKIEEQNRYHPQLFFSPSKNTALLDVLRKSMDQINQNTIAINGKKLEIHTASIPEEVNANRLSSGRRLPSRL